MPKTKKEAKTISQFRLTWNTAKEWASPAALKHVDFPKGLGPLLDKIDRKWDEAADLDPVPEDVAASLVKSLTEAQAIMVKYQRQIAEGNRKHPHLGMTWAALERTLRHLDDGRVQEIRDIGVECRKLPNTTWSPKSAFDHNEGRPACGGRFTRRVAPPVPSRRC